MYNHMVMSKTMVICTTMVISTTMFMSTTMVIMYNHGYMQVYVPPTI